MSLSPPDKSTIDYNPRDSSHVRKLGISSGESARQTQPAESNLLLSRLECSHTKMITDQDMLTVEAAAPNGRWYVHNGFLGWAYGSPLNPTPITRETARRILEMMARHRHPDAVTRLAAFPNALDYADEEDAAFHTTRGNRLIAFLLPEHCVFEPGYRVPPDQDYEL